jgi:hypothetical protein
MTLGELLQELRNNILRDTSSLISGDDDRLWSDETLLRYIGDAERRFARHTLSIRDSTTPEVVRVVLREGKASYALHESVLGVISARYDTDGYDLPRSGHGIINQIEPQETLSFDPSTAISPGRPLAYYTDETLVFSRSGRIVLTVYPTPGADEAGKVISLRVVRLPLTDYTIDKLEQKSEIFEDYQLDVLEWAAYRAQRGNDNDAGATTSSDKHKAAFDEAVQRAIRETKRKMFSPTKVQYGAAGFSGYER